MSEPAGNIDPATIPGGDAHAPWQHPWPAWKAIFGRIYVMTGYHNLSLMAAGVAFYAFLSFVPLMAAVVMTYGLFADPRTVAEHMHMIMRVVPPDAAGLINGQLADIVTTSKSQISLGFAVALVLSIYGAMRAAGAIIQALSVIYEEQDDRSLIAWYWLAARITMVAVLAGVVGLLAAVVLAYLKDAAGVIGQAGVVIVQALTWLVAAAIASFSFGFVYRYGPDRADARWEWLSVGAVVATLLWLVATVLFGIYVANFANYNATYGSLGAVVVLLMWLWVSAYAVLMGAELNAESERQTIIDSTTGPPRPMGERGAVVADTLPSRRQAKPRRDKY
ncbi:MAG: YihY/virulence factor BrkB family protein [Sphingomonas sp.]